MTRNEFEAKIREQIANGEITPEEAESEWDFFVNGSETFQSVYGF